MGVHCQDPERLHHEESRMRHNVCMCPNPSNYCSCLSFRSYASIICSLVVCSRGSTFQWMGGTIVAKLQYCLKIAILSLGQFAVSNEVASSLINSWSDFGRLVEITSQAYIYTLYFKCLTAVSPSLLILLFLPVQGDQIASLGCAGARKGNRHLYKFDTPYPLIDELVSELHVSCSADVLS